MAKTPSQSAVYKNALNNTSSSDKTTFGDKTPGKNTIAEQHKNSYYGENYNYRSTLPNVGGTLKGNTQNCGMAIKPEVLNAKLKNIKNICEINKYHATQRIDEKYNSFQPQQKTNTLPKQPYGLNAKTTKSFNTGNLKTTSGDYGNFKQYIPKVPRYKLQNTSYNKNPNNRFI